jgi:hypothetical protein
MAALNTKDVLQVNDWIGAVLSTHQPPLRAPAPQQGTKVFGINTNACLQRQGDDLFWRGGSVELFLYFGVSDNLMAKVV